MQTTDEKLRNLVRSNFPYPISQSYDKLENLHLKGAYEQFHQILELWEVILRYLAVIVVKNYIYSNVKTDDINQRISNNDCPSSGHWLVLLEACVKLFKYSQKKPMLTEDAGRRVLIDSIWIFLYENFPKKREENVYKHASDLANIINQKQERGKSNLKPDNDSLFNLFLHVRNSIKGCGSKKNEEEY